MLGQNTLTYLRDYIFRNHSNSNIGSLFYTALRCKFFYTIGPCQNCRNGFVSFGLNKKREMNKSFPLSLHLGNNCFNLKEDNLFCYNFFFIKYFEEFPLKKIKQKSQSCLKQHITLAVF